MRMSKQVVLYIKTHTVTGKKYFGMTTREDVHAYSGSGKYWKRHLNIHGYTWTTEIYGAYNSDDEQLEVDALEFSYDNDIVGSKDWANLIVESGTNVYVPENHSMDRVGKKHTEAAKAKMRKPKRVSQIECPVCKKVGATNNMHRYHFDNCKHSGPRAMEFVLRKLPDPTSAIVRRKVFYVKCPVCGKVGAQGNMHRYHFDNCKHRVIN